MSRIERRRPAFTADLLVRVGLVWLVVSAIFLAIKWRAISGLQLPDADDSLRLVQLRDLIAGQGWFDLHQYRVNPPEGMLMHWSRLVDAPLFFTYSALAPLLGSALAERITLVLVPLLTLFTALLLTGRLAWRLLGDGAISYACVVLVLAGAVTGQMQPLRIDHHGWQIVCLLAALNGLAARNERHGGWIAGLAMALGLTISLELLPLAALLGAVLALRWLLDPKASALCLGYVQALALGAGAAFLATRGLADLANHCDTLSPAYFGGLAAMALGLTLLGARRHIPRAALALGLVACGGAAIGLVWVLAPQCSSGPFAMLDPLVQRLWYDNIREGMPIWRQDPGVILRLMVPPLAALAAALALWQRSAGWLRRFWFEYLLILAGTVLLAVVVSRAAGFANAAAALPLGWLLREWHRRARTMRRPGRRLALIAMATLVVMPDLPVQTLRLVTPARATPNLSAQYACNIPAAGPALAGLAPDRVFAQIDIGPMLLLHTRHQVIATAHHRAPRALHDVIAAFTADPDEAEAIVRGRGAGYVAICPALAETAIYRQAAPGGFIAALADGHAPAWLRPVPLPKSSGLLLWAVLPADQAGRKTNASPFMQ